MADQEWLYARIHHTTHADGELLLTTFVPLWLHEGLHAGVQRWFFVRYADFGGPHLRVRFRGTPDALDDCYATGRRLWRTQAPQPTSGEGIERLHPTAEEFLPASGQRRLSFGLYGREHHYYGSPAAVEQAEELFEHSSEFCLDAVVRTGSDRRRRARIAVAAMQGCASALSPTQRERFWQFHWQHWTAALAGDPERLRQTEATVARWQPVLSEEPSLAPDGPDGGDISTVATGLGLALADGVRRALQADPVAVAHHLLLMQLHMTLNRLGFLPLEEAVLGRVAAQAPALASKTHRLGAEPPRRTGHISRTPMKGPAT